MTAKTETAPNHGNLETLAGRLTAAGVETDPSALAGLLRGVAAAPVAEDRDAWMILVAPSEVLAADSGLVADLRAARAALAAEGIPDAALPAVRAGRLEALRAELARRRLAGFLVPRADEHQSEFVPLSAERLAWLTGFAGSAGVAVVLEGCAALFVDGRYTLQAERQVDGTHFDVCHDRERPAVDWIAETLPKGGRLGYDPWLLTPNQAARYRDACVRAGGVLVACADNPLDTVWRDRPPPPLAPAVPHPDALAGRPATEKRAEIGGMLARDGQDAAFLAAPESVAWLFNLRGGDVPFTPVARGFALVHADGTAALFMDPRKLTPAARRHLGDGVDLCAPEDLGPALDTLGGGRKTVRLDRDSAPVWVWRRLREAGADVIGGRDPCALPRACKNVAELAGIRAAHRRDGAAVVRFLAWLAETLEADGTTERAAADRLLALRREVEGFRGCSFETISAAGPNGAVVHYRVTSETDSRLEPGGLYLIDSGGQYPDGTTDVTRTVAVGRPTAEMRDRFTRVLKGHIALARAVFPAGTSGGQLDLLARRALWDAGLDYDHGTGHGVGCFMGVHEGPQRIAKRGGDVALEPGMVLSNEPGYYKAGAYGIRIENLVAVVEVPLPGGAERPLLGFETLTRVPIDRRLVDAALLNRDERVWLDAYHADVFAMIAPLVDAKTRAWLEMAAAPLGGD